jgi:hypothetical protein
MDVVRVLIKLAIFTLLLFALDRAIGSAPVMRLIDRYRPMYGTIDTRTFVERQMLHVETLARTDLGPKVAIVGSSSVVNGVDVALIEELWKESGLAVRPLNYGMTSLLASELPFFRRELLPEDVRAVVVLYNTFAFSDVMNPDAHRTRWSTIEFLRIARGERLTLLLERGIEGLLGELFFSVRYRHLIKNTIGRRLRGTLSEPAHDYDYPIDEPRPEPKARVLEPALDPGEWLRQIYVTSDTDEETIGYRGLARFLEQARAAKKAVIVMPIPEPELASFTKYRRDIDVARIDRHAERIAKEGGAVFIPRSEIADIERDDTNFRDHVHLHPFGRALYSRWLAARLAPLLQP